MAKSTNYKTINHDIRNVNGSHIQIPAWYSGEPDLSWGNLALPNVYVLGTVQKYPHGTFFREGSRTWVYSKFKGTTEQSQTTVTDEDCATHMFGKGLLGHAHLHNHAAGYIKALVASETIVLGTTDTGTNLGTPATAHFYAGGWIVTYDSTAGDNKVESYRIVKSAYSATSVIVSGTTMATPTTLTVDHDTPLAVSASAVCTVMPNQWKHLIYNPGQSASTMSPILGASCVGNITGASWLWVQTYGEIGMVHWHADIPGDEVAQVDLVWNSDGSMDPLEQYPTQQRAGYIVANPKSESGTGVAENYAIVFLTMMR